ncbi:MAG: hypothetical protein IJS93_00820 [Clostridia bacterium]|nr:hypothetical protein [Clostridia bacterium]
MSEANSGSLHPSAIGGSKGGWTASEAVSNCDEVVGVLRESITLLRIVKYESIRIFRD